ncbi:MAG TPA: hypothetical protein VGI03_11620 [Verrucomicrobiae bacterium]|jgi:hypothetical protein
MKAAKKTFQGLTMIRLDTEHSHAIAETTARIYFELSEPPPMGWSYIFTTVWQAQDYPLKCPAKVETDKGALWIECAPEDVVPHHIAQLEEAVAQANATYCEQVRQQALMARHKAESAAQFRAKLEEMSRTLYPEQIMADEIQVVEQSWAGGFFARMKRAILQY